MSTLADLYAQLTYLESKAQECREKAEEYAAKFNRIKANIRLRVLRIYRNRYLGGYTIDELTDFYLSKIPQAGAATSNNQWYMKQAIMYSNEALMLRARLDSMSEFSDEKLSVLDY